jgi:hypothetical protein
MLSFNLKHLVPRPHSAYTSYILLHELYLSSTPQRDILVFNKITGGDKMATAVDNKVWTKEEVKHLLQTSSKMVHRSIVKIFEKQTEDEKRAETTSHHNGVGFNGVDAELLSSYAKQILAGRTLTEKQMHYARKKIVKYAGQLTKIANGTL